jgi:hypothetical protein
MDHSAAETTNEYLDHACRKLSALERGGSLRISHSNLSIEYVQKLTNTLHEATWLNQLEIFDCVHFCPDDIVQLCKASMTNRALWYISFTI